MCSVKLTFSIDQKTLRRARERAEASGKSINQLVREYLELLAGVRAPHAVAAEFVELSRRSGGNSRGWKFNREELHERR
jgi:hypothetical protein